MTEVSNIDLRNIRFNRDYKADYQNGNPYVNSIFRQYDTDGNGVFNDEEYTIYEARIKKQEEIKKYYESRVAESEGKLASLAEEYKKIDTTYWTKFNEFLDAHQDVSLNITKISENDMEVDISAIGIGIWDEEKKCFTGECHKVGYISELENLSEEDRATILELFNKAKEAAEKIQELDKQFQALEAEYDRAIALNDMAESGHVTTILNDDAETVLYSAYIGIRNESNPFYREIKEHEQEISRIQLSGEIPEQEKAALIEQHRIRINQLVESSNKWSIRDANKNSENNEQNKGFNLRDVSETVTYEHSDGQDSITDIHAIQASLNYKNFGLNGGLTKSEKYGLNNGSFENLWNANLSASYRYRGFSVNSNSMVDSDDSHTTYNQTLGAELSVKKFSFNASENLTYMYMSQGESTSETTSLTTNISTSLTTGKFTTTAEAAISPKNGDEYSISSNASLNIGKVGINPSFRGSYNSTAETYTLQPNLGLSYNLTHGDFSLGTRASETWSTTIQNGSKPQLNHNFNASGNVGYKNLSLNMNFCDSDNSFNHSNTYGVGVQYQTPKAGTFGVDYSYQRQNSKMPQGSLSETSMVSFKYSLPLDWTHRKKH